MTIDPRYMDRALELAALGGRSVMPNPMVGAVLVHDTEIIGEGYHEFYGGPHAEVNAIRAVRDRSKLSRATLYVTLEPCSHFGKTPPCADLVVESGISEVVIGCRDPFPEVSGKGIEKLRAAGVRVTEMIRLYSTSALSSRIGSNAPM
jgi:diaminohydroxyphosphoribosylaminopyrimidine deaminase/5-amino-6-(5-phosphoribosylamino)uracil reductase